MNKDDAYNDEPADGASMGPPTLIPSPSELHSSSSPYTSSSGKNSSDTNSSGKGTGNSSETNGTPSSSDTVPVPSSQEATDESGDSEAPVWGIAHAMQAEFFHLELVKDQYVFGRAKQCDYCFDIPSIKSNKFHKMYSKLHFAIKRTTNSDGSTAQVILEDLGGTNGTYVNGEKVPSKKQRCLQSLDKIGLSYNWNNVFLFVDNNANRNTSLPSSFTDKYIQHKSIGKGACGEVFEVWLKEGVGRFACKVINKSRLSLSVSAHNRDITDEAKILRKLSHPCIIAVEDVIDSPMQLYIVLEYAAGGELFDRLTQGQQLSESLAKLYFYQMLCAVSYLHDNGITHRDLKPENILLMTKDEPCLLKITDFGMSRLVDETSLMMTLAGTPLYLAPEIIHRINSRSSPGYTKQVDMWSIGVILYVCLVAYPPFSNDRNDTTLDINHQITSANYNFNNSRWKHISSTAKNLITQLLKLNASERLNTTGAIDHPWLDDADMRKKAEKLMFPNMHSAEITLMGEKSLSSDSYDTRKISTDADGEGSRGSDSIGKSDSDEFITGVGKRVSQKSNESSPTQAKKAKFS